MEASMRQANDIDVFSSLDRVHLAQSDPLKVRRITNPVDEVHSFCVIASETGNAADLNRHSAFRNVDRVFMMGLS